MDHPTEQATRRKKIAPQRIVPQQVPAPGNAGAAVLIQQPQSARLQPVRTSDQPIRPTAQHSPGTAPTSSHPVFEAAASLDRGAAKILALNDARSPASQQPPKDGRASVHNTGKHGPDAEFMGNEVAEQLVETGQEKVCMAYMAKRHYVWRNSIPQCYSFLAQLNRLTWPSPSVQLMPGLRTTPDGLCFHRMIHGMQTDGEEECYLHVIQVPVHDATQPLPEAALGVGFEPECEHIFGHPLGDLDRIRTAPYMPGAPVIVAVKCFANARHAGGITLYRLPDQDSSADPDVDMDGQDSTEAPMRQPQYSYESSAGDSQSGYGLCWLGGADSAGASPLQLLSTLKGARIGLYEMEHAAGRSSGSTSSGRESSGLRLVRTFQEGGHRASYVGRSRTVAGNSSQAAAVGTQRAAGSSSQHGGSSNAQQQQAHCAGKSQHDGGSLCVNDVDASGDLVASVGDDGQLLVWDVRQPGSPSLRMGVTHGSPANTSVSAPGSSSAAAATAAAAAAGHACAQPTLRRVDCASHLPLNAVAFRRPSDHASVQQLQGPGAALPSQLVKPSSYQSPSSTASACVGGPGAPRTLAAAGDSGRVMLFDLAAPSQPVDVLRGPDSPLVQLAWCPHASSVLASVDIQGRVLVYDVDIEADATDRDEGLNTAPQLLAVHGGHMQEVLDFAWSPSIPFMAASTSSGADLELLDSLLNTAKNLGLRREAKVLEAARQPSVIQLWRPALDVIRGYL